MNDRDDSTEVTEVLREIASQLRIANLILAYDRDALIYPGINNAAPGSDEWHLRRLARNRFEQQIAQQVTEALDLNA